MIRLRIPFGIFVALIAFCATETKSFAQSTYTWNLNAAGTWDTATSNWLLAGAPANWANGANTAAFGDVITASRSIAIVAGGVTTGQISFTNTGTFAYTLGTVGNTITLNNGGSDAVIGVGSGFVGTAVYAGTGGNTITGSTISYANNLILNNNGAFGTTNLTVAGSIDRASAGGAITANGQGNTTISGSITANTTGGIIKNGTGTLHLSGTNLFTGGLTVNSGVLSVSGDTALGAAANGVSLNGGTLRFSSSTTLGASRVVTIGASGGGIDVNAVTATIGSAGQLTGSGSLLLSTTNSSTGGNIAITIGAQSGFIGTLTVGAPGLQLIGSVAAQRVFNSSNGTGLTLGGTTAGNNGSLPNASSLTLNNGAALSITQPTVATVGRLGATMPIISNSGRFLYTGSANGGSAISETFGNVTATGVFTISGSGTAGPTVGTSLNFGTLTRTDNAMLLFRAPQSGTQGTFGGTPSALTQNIFFSGLTPDTVTSGVTRSVVPWAGNATSTTSNDPQNFMTYDSNGFRPLNTTTEISTTISAGANVRTGSSLTIPAGGESINSYSSTTTTSLTGTATASTPGDILTISSGAISTFNTFTWTNATVNFPNGAYFHLGFPFAVTTNSRITGSNGVTVGSLGASTSYALRFTNTPNGGNSFTGGLFINGNAGVLFTLNNQLGNDGGGLSAGDIKLGGGQLLFNGTVNASLSDTGTTRTISVNASNGTIGAANTGILQIPGTINGVGQVQFGGGASSSATGIVELTNNSANTYSGGTVVSTGILRISNPNQLGSGAILLNGGTLQAATGTTHSFSSPLTVIASSTISTQDAIVTLAGGLNGSGGTTGSATTSNALSRTGSTTAASSLIISGAGNFAGTITNNVGALTLNGNGKLPELSGITLTATAASATQPSILNIDNSTTNIADRTGRATSLTLSNGGFAASNPTVNLTTNTAGSTFRFGTLAISGGTATNQNTATLNVIDGGSGNNTIRFTSLTALATNNFWNIVGTTNLGKDTVGGSRIFFDTAPALTAGIITGITFTGFGGTVVSATYDSNLGLTAYLQTAGSFIDNFNNVGPGSITPVTTNFLTNAATTANLGATVKSLTIAGHTATLVPSVYSSSNTLVLSGGVLTSITGASQVASASSTVLQFGATGTTLASITTTTDLTIGANVTPTTTGGLIKAGAGALTINGTNAITGAYDLSGGITNLPLSGTTAASLTNSGPLNLNAAPLTLNGSATMTFSGIISGAAGSNITTTVGFTGVQTISGANTFNGNVNINGGTLVAGNSSALGSATNVVNVNSGGSLGFSGGVTIANTNPVSISGVGATGRNGAIDNISGTNSFAGPITLSGATTIGTTAGALTLSGVINATNVNLGVSTLSGTLTLTTNPLNIGTGVLSKSGAGSFVLPNFPNTFASVLVTGGDLQFNAASNFSGAPVTLDGGGITYLGATTTLSSLPTINAGGGSIGVNTAATVLTLGGALTQNGPLTKAGAGTLQLAAATPLTTPFGLSINAGIFDVNANNVSVGGLSGTGGTLALGSTSFTSTQTSTTTFSGVISGAGATVTMNGVGGVLTLAGTNTYTGLTTITAGTVRLGAASGIPNAGNVTVAAAGTFDTVGSFNNTATPIGTVTLNGGTMLATTGSSDYYLNKVVATGATINFVGTTNFWYHFTGTAAGIQTLASSTTTTITGPTTGSRIQNDTTAILPIDVALGSTSNGIDLNVNAQVSGSGTNANFAKNGPGALQLSFPGTVTGNFAVNAGLVRVAAGTTVSGTVAVASGGTIGGNGSITGAVTIAPGGALAPGSSIGTLTVANNVTFTGSPTSTPWNIEVNGIAANTASTTTTTDSDRLLLTGAANNLNFVTTATDRIVLNISKVGGSFTFDGNPVYYRIAEATTTSNIQTNAGAFDSSHFDFNFIGFTASSATLSLDASTNAMVVSFVPTPEPGTILGLSALAIGGMGYVRRRRMA